VRLESVAFWTLLAVAVALLVGLVAIVVGVVPVSDGESRPEAAAPVGATTAPKPTTSPAETEPGAAPAPTSSPVVLVRAVGGDCWVEAREGSATGRVLYVGLLAQGSEQQLPVRRVWLRLGAGENVVVMAGGRRAPIPAGTNDVVVSA
jgi:hypothetical protein